MRSILKRIGDYLDIKFGFLYNFIRSSLLRVDNSYLLKYKQKTLLIFIQLIECIWLKATLNMIWHNDFSILLFNYSICSKFL